MKLLTLIIILVVATSCTYQPRSVKVVGENWIYAPAVTRTKSGYTGVLVNISLVVMEGRGEVYVSTTPLTEIDMQATATIAARTACKLLGLKFEKYTFLYKLESDSVIIGGPSAGAVMTVLAYAVLSGRPINRTVMMTGTINPDGTIGLVGGIKEKAEAAARAGARLFLVPPSQSVITAFETRQKRVGPFILRYVTPVTINLSKYAYEKWGLRVVEVRDIREAIKEFLGVEIGGEKAVSVAPPPRLLQAVKKVSGDLELEVKKTLEKAMKEISEAPYILRWDAYRYIEAANSTLQAVEGDPITRFSSLRSALKNAEQALLILSLSESSKLEALVEECEALVNNSLDASKGAPLIVAHYALHAHINMKRAAEVWEESQGAAISYLSNAFVDAVTATSLSKNLAGVKPLVRVKASEAISEARALLSYAEALLSGERPVWLDKAISFYEESKTFLSTGDHLLACVAAIESAAMSETAITSRQASINSLVAKTLLELSREKASISANNSLTPVFFILLGDSSRRFDNAYLNYRLATYYAQLEAGVSLRIQPQPPSLARNVSRKGSTEMVVEGRRYDMEELFVLLLVVALALIIYLLKGRSS